MFTWEIFFIDGKCKKAILVNQYAWVSNSQVNVKEHFRSKARLQNIPYNFAILQRTTEGIFCADDFQYDPETDSLICPNNIRMSFLSYSPKTGTKRYTCTKEHCSICPLRNQCIAGKTPCRQIDRAYHKYEMDIQHLNDNTPDFKTVMKLRQIYCEGNFSHQKAKHNLTWVRMWGIGKVFEHYLLSATALNLKEWSGCLHISRIIKKLKFFSCLHWQNVYLWFLMQLTCMISKLMHVIYWQTNGVGV